MTPDLVVAVDCSTTAAKAVVLDSAGEVLAAGSAALATSQPQPLWHEQDAREWWTATRAAVRTALAQVDAARIGAICVTHQRETFVCLDEDGVPLRPAILWVDARAHEEIADLGTADVHRISGKPADTTPALYKLAWLSRHEPQVLAAAARIGDVQAYLAWRMTGTWATSRASADTLGLLDLKLGDWSPELLALAGVRRDQLPWIVPAGHAIGSLTAEVAADLGLPGSVVLVAGIGDGQSAGLALGAADDGVAYLNLGTSMVLGVRADAYVWDRAFRTLDGMVPGTFTLETVLNAAAYLALWFRREVGTGGADDPVELTRLEEAAALVPAGSDGLLTLPYWNAAQTPYWDPLARGAVIGLHGAHTRAHLYRSILEGVAFELRLHIDGIERATGAPIVTFRAVGGGARSELWARIIADVTQRTVVVCSAGEISAAGSGILARAWLDDTPDAPTWAPPTGVEVVPDARAAGRYTRLFEVYRGLYPALRDSFAALPRG